MPRLSRIQRLAFTNYLKWRHQPPTTARIWLAPRALFRLGLIVCLLGLLSLIFAQLGGEPALGVGLICFLVGMLSMEFVLTVRMIQFWPALSHVLDWDRVERTLQRDMYDGGPTHGAGPGDLSALPPRPVSDNPYQSPGE